MPRYLINGEAKDVAAQDVRGVLAAEAIPEAHWPSLAVAHNGSVLPRAAWAATRLAEGDRLEIVMPFVGG